MEINISDSAEFKRLLESLVGELIDARDHFKLHQNLDAAIADYGVGLNEYDSFAASPSARVEVFPVRHKLYRCGQ